jgi:hypothetical protein
MGTLPKIREENVSELQMVFIIFPFYVNVKLLVCCKTLIYCGQLCNNAVNYPSTPLTANLMVTTKGSSIDLD